MKTMKQLLVNIWNDFVDVLIWIQKKIYFTHDLLVKSIVTPPSVLSIEDTINEIIINKKSVCRYGDGEFKLMHGMDIQFQHYNKELNKKLKQILVSNEEHIMVCIPDIFNNLNKYSDEPQKYWKLHISKTRFSWYRLINKNIIYGNSFISRPYYMYKNKDLSGLHFDMMKKIWDNRSVIIIEGDKSRLGIGNDLFNNVKSIERILVPAKNAYDRYEKVLESVNKLHRDKLILIAAGPMATVLAFDLTKEGFQAIDIGHIDIEYEWFIRKAVKKENIENKYVGEVAGGDYVESCNDDNYLKQIITRIN